jgi:photosystem II stability/assembly factor-like uncharacterized protein
MTTLAVSPDYARDQTLLAGVLGFGIFKSTDGGRLWQPSSAGLTYMRADEILLSPGFGQDQTVFTDAGWYRSKDGGRTWQTLADLLAGQPKYSFVEALALSPEFADDGIVMGAVYDNDLQRSELYLSHDGGDRWELRGAMPEGVSLRTISLAPLFAKWQTLFVSGYNKQAGQYALYRSSDGGRSWETVLPLGANTVKSLVYAADIEENRPIFLLAGEMVYRSGDGGLTWQVFERAEGINPTALAISPDFAQDRSLFVGTAGGQVLTLKVSEEK